MVDRPLKIVYCTPALYMAGGVERVLTLKANYFVDHFGYDITIILTEGKDKPSFYPLSNKIKIVNLDLNFEELWTCSFVKKIFVYLKKQYRFKRLLKKELFRLRPDITVSLLRREINFINDIKDGSKKVGELHVNRANYRNFEADDTNLVKTIFANIWMRRLVSHLKKLDRFVVLTYEDKQSWLELDNVEVISDPLTFDVANKSSMSQKRVIGVGRYVYQKGFDLLLQAWSIVENKCKDWELVIYGMGNRAPYEKIIDNMQIDRTRCHLYGPTNNIKHEYLSSSLFVLSSRFEGFGMVIVEAMACGLPVVSFDCPCGPKDIINNKNDGFLVENGNVGQLAEVMVKLMQDEKLRIIMSENASKNVQRFSIEKIALQWKKLFEEL